MNQPNPELWARFLASVDAGAFRDLNQQVTTSTGHCRWLNTSTSQILLEDSIDVFNLERHEMDHLCGEIRRWMESKGWKWDSGPTYLTILYTLVARDVPTHLTGKTEIDRHLKAALYVVEYE
jgi:hypothetical protein